MMNVEMKNIEFNRVFIDDQLRMVKDTAAYVKTAEEAIELLRTIRVLEERKNSPEAWG